MYLIGTRPAVHLQQAASSTVPPKGWCWQRSSEVRQILGTFVNRVLKTVQRLGSLGTIGAVLGTWYLTEHQCTLYERRPRQLLIFHILRHHPRNHLESSRV
jgi:hypothetical protein